MEQNGSPYKLISSAAEINQLTKENEELMREIRKLTNEQACKEDEARKRSSPEPQALRFNDLNLNKEPITLRKHRNPVKGYDSDVQQPGGDRPIRQGRAPTDPHSRKPTPLVTSTDSSFSMATALSTTTTVEERRDRMKAKKSEEDSHRNLQHLQTSDDYSPKGERLAERLIGEIAFQLDKRILHNVFSHRKRLYGFNVRNISEKITEYTKDIQTGEVDVERRDQLRAKHKATMTFLARQAGYDPVIHPMYAETLINKFGVLRVVKGKNDEQYKDVTRPEYLKAVVLNTMEPVLTFDTLVILNSLVAFSKQDGKPLFMW